MTEEWREVKDYEGFYQVSNMGRVRSLTRKVNCRNGKTRILLGRILKPGSGKEGTWPYYSVNLSKYGITKMRSVHRLVATAFIDNPNNLPFVNHKDEDKLNNRADNLEWLTLRDNTNYGTAIKRAIEKKKGKGKKRVYQYDKNGNLVKHYAGTIDCELDGYNKKSVSASICTGSTYKGYYWSHRLLVQTGLEDQEGAS